MTPFELERRRSVVGASEVGLLFGLPSFGGRTLSDLWYEKKYGTLPSKGNKSTDLGNKLEPVILAEAEDRLGTKIVDRQLWLTNGACAATLDGRCESDGALVDAKTSGILWPDPSSQWGDELTDDVPEPYLLQMQSQMLVSKAELAYLAALIGGRGFAIFKITPFLPLMESIKNKATAFIESLSSDVAPAQPPQLDTLKRLRRQPKKVLPQSDEFDDLRVRFEEAKATAKASEEAKELLQRQILAAMGDAEAIECDGGMVTYYEHTTKAHYKAESTFRVLRFKKG